MFRTLKGNKGITLIALVVTIIVLIILAGISISLLLGNNGILNKAKDSAKQQEIGQRKEAVSMAVAAEFTNKLGDKSQVTVEGILTELRRTQNNNSIYAKKGGTDITDLTGTTYMSSDVTFIFPGASNPSAKTDIEIVVDSDLKIKSATAAGTTTTGNQSQGGSQQTTTDVYGFYNASGTQIASWSTLVASPYYLNVEKDYTETTSNQDNGASGNSARYVIDHWFPSTTEVRIPGTAITGSTNVVATVASIEVPTLKVATTINAVTKIGNYAFYRISSLTGVSIPASVTTIGEYAFGYCDDLIVSNDVLTGKTVAPTAFIKTAAATGSSSGSETPAATGSSSGSETPAATGSSSGSETPTATGSSN